MLVTPNLHFSGDCREALQLYENAFDGKLTVLLSYRDANPHDMPVEGLSDAEKDFVYHAEMMIGTQRFMFNDNKEPINRGQNISIVITFDSPDAVKHAYSILVEGCTIIHPMTETTYSSCFVSLVDRFGMRWELMTEN